MSLKRRLQKIQRFAARRLRAQDLLGQTGQTTVEYLLVVSVIVIAIYGAMLNGFGPRDPKGSMAKGFDNFRVTVEAPYP